MWIRVCAHTHIKGFSKLYGHYKHKGCVHQFESAIFVSFRVLLVRLVLLGQEGSQDQRYVRMSVYLCAPMSAHVDMAESEFICASNHSVLQLDQASVFVSLWTEFRFGHSYNTLALSWSQMKAFKHLFAYQQIQAHIKNKDETLKCLSFLVQYALLTHPDVVY